jgi:integrase
MARLTAKTVENAKPRAARVEVPDSGCRGLYLIVQPSGRKAWAVRYRFQGKPRKLTLNGVGSLAAARKAATDALHELELGNDPASLKFDAKAAEEKAAALRAGDTVDNLASQFIERYAKKQTRENSWRMTQRIFDRIVLPAWRGRIIHDIKRRDVIDLVEGVAERTPILANRVHAALSKFFNWLASRDVIVASPCAGVARPSKEQPRDRILNDEEIKAVWTACDAIGGQGGACVKMMLITGQRRGEVAGMRRGEIEGDMWTLPPERTKNGQKHLVPLSRQAMAIIKSMPQIVGDVDYVFPGSGNRRLAGFSHIKDRIDARTKFKAPWTIHDLRRTVASGMARIGITLPVIERVLNHAGGSFAGIVGVYQRHDYAAERRQALETWGTFVADLVSNRPPRNVVSLHKAGRRA